jgi:hypothetical protein
MFREAAPIGHLDVQLVFFRGTKCQASKWVGSGEQLAQLMSKIKCETGPTQIGRVLAHVRREMEQVPVQALVFIGDAMEEDLKELTRAAGELGVPIFMFHEPRHPPIGPCETIPIRKPWKQWDRSLPCRKNDGEEESHDHDSQTTAGPSNMDSDPDGDAELRSRSRIETCR